MILEYNKKHETFNNVYTKRGLYKFSYEWYISMSSGYILNNYGISLINILHWNIPYNFISL